MTYAGIVHRQVLLSADSAAADWYHHQRIMNTSVAVDQRVVASIPHRAAGTNQRLDHIEVK